MSDQEGTEGLASRVRSALDSADLEAFAELLDPNVHWGPPGDPSPPCQSRQQVLEWYRRGRADGRQARVLDVSTLADKICVQMKVTGGRTLDTRAESDRWQVLTVAGGRVIDIRGYDNQTDAKMATGLPT